MSNAPKKTRKTTPGANSKKASSATSKAAVIQTPGASEVVLPPYEVFVEQLGIDETNADAQVTLPVGALKALLALAARSTHLDVRTYAELNPDVGEEEARRHFATHGYFEGRRTDWNVVDDRYYAARYPDVAQGLANGHFPSAQSHFDNNGVRELRVPRASMEAVVGFWQVALAKPKA